MTLLELQSIIPAIQLLSKAFLLAVIFITIKSAATVIPITGMVIKVHIVFIDFTKNMTNT